jgi:hypothetical protein
VGITQIRGGRTTRKAETSDLKSNIGNLLPESQVPSPLERSTRKQGVNNAMAQQRCDHNWGNQWAPQKLLHLVGCREPKPRPTAPATQNAKPANR